MAHVRPSDSRADAGRQHTDDTGPPAPPRQTLERSCTRTAAAATGCHTATGRRESVVVVAAAGDDRSTDADESGGDDRLNMQSGGSRQRTVGSGRGRGTGQ